jgi:hypothetical protein
MSALLWSNNFLTKEIKTKIDYLQLLLLALFLALLNSKSIIFVDILLVGLYFFFYSKSANKMRLRNIVLLGIIFFSFLFFNRIKEKIEFEFQWWIFVQPKPINHQWKDQLFGNPRLFCWFGDYQQN